MGKERIKGRSQAKIATVVVEVASSSHRQANSFKGTSESTQAKLTDRKLRRRRSYNGQVTFYQKPLSRMNGVQTRWKRRYLLATHVPTFPRGRRNHQAGRTRRSVSGPWPTPWRWWRTASNRAWLDKHAGIVALCRRMRVCHRIRVRETSDWRRTDPTDPSQRM